MVEWFIHIITCRAIFRITRWLLFLDKAHTKQIVREQTETSSKHLGCASIRNSSCMSSKVGSLTHTYTIHMYIHIYLYIKYVYILVFNGILWLAIRLASLVKVRYGISLLPWEMGQEGKRKKMRQRGRKRGRKSEPKSEREREKGRQTIENEGIKRHWKMFEMRRKKVEQKNSALS